VRVVLLFIDGVGIGRKRPEENPLARREHLLSHFVDGEGTALPDGGRLHRVDAAFGVAGRPQSATGQTAILTGEPAPVMLGKHLLGFPNAALRSLLNERSIARRLVERGRNVTFANAYPAGYLDALNLPRRPSAGPDITLPPRAVKKLRPSATTLAMAAAGVALRTFDDARNGEALTHDIDARRAVSHGLDVPERSPDEAADILWRIANAHDFTLFEHYLADEAGHAQSFTDAIEALDAFDTFTRAVVAQRPRDAQVLICSDHGNVEDLSTRSHTVNAVPVLSFGDAARDEAPFESVADVGRRILTLLDAEDAT
jgi:hypothetical protein